jgi:sulfatase maturation enzyme AslB (radical SAM superfamily)
MENKINKHFCIQPFVNTTTRVNGENFSCCNISQSKSNIKTESPQQFFNSDYTKEFRKKLLDGEELIECGLCQYQEKKSNNSHRIEYNKYYKIQNNQPKEYYHKIINRLRISELKNPLYSDLHISNLCNLKCLSCNDKDSSKFHAENKLLNNSKFPDENFSVTKSKMLDAINSVITNDLLFLDIRGGETLMVPEVKNVLKKISDERASKITLKIQTNGNIVPDDDWCNLFKKFKRTKVNVSVDAYGDDNHYIRYPSNWSKILKTIEILKKQNIKFLINTVVSNLNILVLDELFSWIQEHNHMNYFYILTSPSHYGPTNLPQSLLDIAIKRLQNVKKNFKNTECHQKLDDLIEMCKISDQTHWNSFCKEIIMRDNFRKNNITDVIPEIGQHLENFKISLNNRKENNVKV